MTVERDIEIALCVFREANDALIVFNPADRRVVDLNPAALRLTRLEKKAALGLELSDLISAVDPAAFRQLLDACQRTGYFHSREGYELTRKSQPPIPVNLSISRIHTSPEPLALAMIRDVSGRKKVEDDLRKARDELELRVQERTAELLLAKEVAEAAGRVKDRFLSVLSHELRTPLTPVLAVVSALLDDPATSIELRPTLEMIRRSVRLEARLIDDLLDLTRLKQGQVRLERESVDALGLVRQAADLCQTEIKAASPRLVLESDVRIATVEADPTRLLQVLCNLIHNAVKFTDPGGTIVVKATNVDQDSRLVVSVSDDGQGIAPEAFATIFEPFEQGLSSLPSGRGGLGLGLSMGRSIIEAHGGTLLAASAGLGQGSTFTFELPTARPASTNSISVAASDLKPAPARQGLKILVVEDNRDVLRYLKIVLEMQGHKVTTAVDLTTARRTIDGSFDLLISDIQLPDGTGLELMQEFRGQLPGLAISGFGSPEDIRMSLDAGFARHLTKPVEIAYLEAAIHEVIAAFAP